jgi:hypothetical protein
MADNDKMLAESHEMDQFYRLLAIAHSNSLARVIQAGDPEKIIERAKREIERLIENIGSPDKCANGQVWDEKLGRCVYY